jgi:hypothetical protein
MNTPIQKEDELELKVLVPSAKVFQHVIQHFQQQPNLRTGTPATKTLYSVFYDTPDRQLEKNGVALRIRFDTRTHQADISLKSKGKPLGQGVVHRKEYEAALTAPELNLTPLRALKGPEVDKLFSLIGNDPAQLQETAWLVDQRTLFDVQLPFQGANPSQPKQYGLYEFAFDRCAYYLPGQFQTPLAQDYELECEFKHEPCRYSCTGSKLHSTPQLSPQLAKAGLTNLSQQVQALLEPQHALNWQGLSKKARAFQYLQGQPSVSTPPRIIPLKGTWSPSFLKQLPILSPDQQH